MYQSGHRLSAERANKMGHLEVINSELTKKIINELETPICKDDIINVNWNEVEESNEILQTVFCVDGSLQTISSQGYPKKELTFIKTALLTLDQKALSKVDPDYPHPGER